MKPATHVSLADLRLAFDWVSDGAVHERCAYVSLERGTFHWLSDDGAFEEDVPDDLDDPSRYVLVPHERELGLGKDVALRFVRDKLPSSAGLVRDLLHQKGGWRRFKDLLGREGLLDAWYAFEESAAERALRSWCGENGLILDP